MKKLIVLFCTFLLIIALASCGNDGTMGDENYNNNIKASDENAFEELDALQEEVLEEAIYDIRFAAIELPDNAHPFAVALQEFFAGGLCNPQFGWQHLVPTAFMIDIDGNQTEGMVVIRAERRFYELWDEYITNAYARVYFMCDGEIRHWDSPWAMDTQVGIGIVENSGRMYVLVIGGCTFPDTYRILYSVVDGELVQSSGLHHETMEISEDYMNEMLIRFRNYINGEWQEITEEEYDTAFEEYGFRNGIMWGQVENQIEQILMMTLD